MPVSCRHCFTRFDPPANDDCPACPGCGRIGTAIAQPQRRQSRLFRPTRLLLTVGAVATMALSLVAGLMLFARSGDGSSPHGGGAQTAEEEAVRRRILDNAPAPESVDFVRWGPHLTMGEMEAQRGRPFRPDAAPTLFPSLESEVSNWRGLYRVVWRGRNRAGVVEQHDALFVVFKNGISSPGEKNTLGDRWKEVFRRDKARP